MNADPDQPEIVVSNRQDLPVEESDLIAAARQCLVGEGAPNTEVSVSLVGEEEIQALNLRYAGEEGSTDVLSFPLDESDGGRRVLGDVVICPAVAQRNNPDLASELRLLVVHGVLHLLGYDHELETERADMWARQERYSGVRA